MQGATRQRMSGPAGRVPGEKEEKEGQKGELFRGTIEEQLFLSPVWGFPSDLGNSCRPALRPCLANAVFTCPREGASRRLGEKKRQGIEPEKQMEEQFGEKRKMERRERASSCAFCLFFGDVKGKSTRIPERSLGGYSQGIILQKQTGLESRGWKVVREAGRGGRGQGFQHGRGFSRLNSSTFVLIWGGPDRTVCYLFLSHHAAERIP